MINVNEDGTIANCYNSQATGSAMSTPPCGFTVNNFNATGTYLIDFGFKVSDRFYSVTPDWTGFDTDGNRGAMTDRRAPASPNTLFVFTFNSDNNARSNNPFTAIVF